VGKTFSCFEFTYNELKLVNLLIRVGAMIIEKVFMIFIKLLAYLVVFVLFFGLITII